MSMSCDEFVARFLSRAEVLTKGHPDPLAAERLCRETFKQKGPEDLSDPRKANVALAEVYYESLDPTVDTEEALKKVFGNVKYPSHLAAMPFAQFLDLVLPILWEIPLVDRVKAGTEILGWDNASLVELIGPAVAALAGTVKPTIRLCEGPRILLRFAKEIVDRLVPDDKHSAWLRKVIVHENDAISDAESLKALIRLCSRCPSGIFAREGMETRDKYGWLRDRWKDWVEHVRFRILEVSKQRESAETRTK